MVRFEFSELVIAPPEFSRNIQLLRLKVLFWRLVNPPPVSDELASPAVTVKPSRIVVKPPPLIVTTCRELE